MPPISFWSRLLDLISPRMCVVCGRRLSVTEEVICGTCNLHLPRTGFQQDPYENIMAKMFWGKIPVERAAALFYYEPHAETANILYELKYKNHPEIGEVMGRLTARELQRSNFFDGIDAIIPVPLARKREQQRGYNQSHELAKGIGKMTGLPIYNKVVRRTVFEGSQTSLGRWERNENVENVFEVRNINTIRDKHLLVVDDVVTTGATVIACAKELCKAGGVRISILSLGLAKNQ